MNRTYASAAGLLTAGALTGAILTGTLTANAATTSSASSTSSTSSAAATASPTAPANNFSSTPVRSDESAVSSSLAATLSQKAAAKTGGTVYRVETDAGDGTYEAHVRKSDGTLVTVKFDAKGAITAVEAGMGNGDPAPAGGMAPGAAGTSG